MIFSTAIGLERSKQGLSYASTLKCSGPGRRSTFDRPGHQAVGRMSDGAIRRSIYRLVANGRPPLSCLSCASLLLPMSVHVDAQIGRTEGVR
jgi:hypothetical protein